MSSYMKEKVAYIRGLMDGLAIADEGQKKLFTAIVETLDVMADAIEENETSINELDECVDDIYEEIESIDDCLFDDEDEDDFVELECPHCGEVIYYDESMLESDEDLICPQCSKVVVPSGCGECGCGCADEGE